MYLQVDGVLEAVGTKFDPIIFTSNQASPMPGDWKNIRLFAMQPSALSHCIVEYSDSGIELANGSHTVEYSAFRYNGAWTGGTQYNAGDTALLVGSGSPFVYKNVFYENIGRYESSNSFLILVSPMFLLLLTESSEVV